jgi:hypothetical protein
MPDAKRDRGVRGRLAASGYPPSLRTQDIGKIVPGFYPGLTAVLECSFDSHLAGFSGRSEGAEISRVESAKSRLDAGPETDHPFFDASSQHRYP